MPNEPDSPADETLARIERDLQLLRQGLSLLNVKPCVGCQRFFRADPGALFDDGHSQVCFGCVPEWWPRRSPDLSLKDREFTEQRLVRWLLAHHQAHIVHQAEKLPPDQPQAFRLVADCEECHGSGSMGGSRCHYCNGRGTLWVVIPKGPV